MPQQKRRKRRRTSKFYIQVWYLHSSPLIKRRTWLNVLSIDPGTRNLGIIFEQRYLFNPPFTLFGARIKLCERARLDYIATSLCDLITNYYFFFLEADLIIIENQIRKNLVTPAVVYMILALLTELYRHHPVTRPHLIIEIDSRMKSQVLGAPSKLGRSELKAWITTKAETLLKQRGCNVLPSGRKHDVADAACQIEALFQYWQEHPEILSLPWFRSHVIVERPLIRKARVVLV